MKKTIQRQFRCPICKGRLFDITAKNNKNAGLVYNYMIIIKCWKCSNKIKIVDKDLVQTPLKTNED